MSKKIKIGFTSDLHLEMRRFNFKNIIKMNSDVLCLAGDICACGNPQDFIYLKAFLKYICPKYKYIIHVPGNHEYYSENVNYITKENTIQYINKKLKNLQNEFNNYIFLNNESITLNINSKPYVFLGTILWSYINPRNYEEIEEIMNDYNHIYYIINSKIEKFNVPYMQKLFNKNYNFIKNCIKNLDKNSNCVLITHHKPIILNKSNDIMNEAYETDLSELIANKNSPINYAIHGHTHQQFYKKINNTIFLSNPKGYINQHTLFKKNWVIEL
jgi:Icc-related predicted phosphoesterase